MVKITEKLIRKKSEHNEGIINSLEELSLHQEDVDKIEHINNWCKNLEILYLQANLISKIENLNKLKKLKYLTLAINNIEVIENLERCESLEKLDLTLNFIGHIQSVCSLKNNANLKHLYLTGNPCCDFDGYRIYVVAKLTQLETLDNEEITRTEKIKALQTLSKIEYDVIDAQAQYKVFRAAQHERLKHIDQSIDDDVFWKSTSENAPETRVEISRRSRRGKGKDEVQNTEKKSVSLFRKDGKPLNINQAKLNFKFSEEDPKEFVLDIAVYKYLDTNFIQVDLQPIYVKVLIKDKIFQFVFPEEISTNNSTAKRSQTTGHLVLTMPKVSYKGEITGNNKDKKLRDIKSDPVKERTKSTYLEVSPEDDSMDFSKIVENNKLKRDYLDNSDVPPLEYC